MENTGQFQSLFKSFRRSHPQKDSTEGPPSVPKPTGRPATAQKTVDQLLAGRKEAQPPADSRKEPDSEQELRRRRKSIDDILSGAKVKRPVTYASRMGLQGDSGEPLSARKPIAEILSSSSTSIRALKSSHAKPNLGYMGPSSPTVPTVTRSVTELPKKPEVVLRQTQSQRVLFDFSSTPTKATRAKSVHETLVPVRSKILTEQVEISPSTSVITFSPSGHGSWQKNQAFDALMNNIQDDTQTDDFDSRDDEESQTDFFNCGTKWSQHPPKFSSRGKLNKTLLKAEASGSCSDPLKASESAETLEPMSKVTEAISLPHLTPHEEEENFERFTRNTSKLLLALVTVHSVKSDINMDEKDGDDKGKRKKKTKVTEFDRGLDYLNKLNMHTLDCGRSHVACANVLQKDLKGAEKLDATEAKNIITVWTNKDILMPKYFLRVWGQVTTIKLAFGSDIIVAGSHNGGLNIWDIREDEKKHVEFEGVYVRTPSFHTGCIEGQNHHSSIIGLEVLAETRSSAQIISLEKDHKIICWSCIHSPVVDRNDISVNSVPWSTLRVKVRQVLNLPELFHMNALTSTCMRVWEGHHKYFVIGSNNGFVGKGRIVASTFDTHCEKFFTDTRDSLIRIHNVDVNPKVNLIIAACGDSNIRIFEMTKQKAIISIACVDVPKKVLWSKQRLSVFYVAFKDQVLIWDLIASDFTPMKKCRSTSLVDFALVMHDDKESMIVMSLGGKKLFRVVPPCNLTPLDESQEKLMRHYIMVSL